MKRETPPVYGMIRLLSAIETTGNLTNPFLQLDVEDRRGGLGSTRRNSFTELFGVDILPVHVRGG